MSLNSHRVAGVEKYKHNENSKFYRKPKLTSK